MCIESDWQLVLLTDLGLGLIKHSEEKWWNRSYPVPSPMLSVCWRDGRDTTSEVPVE